MKKKILFFTNGLYGGGAEQILLTLLTHIDYTLFNITLYSLTKDDVTKEYPEQIHYNYIFHPISDQDNCWRRITKKIINKFKHLIYHHFSAKLFYALFVKGNYDTEVAFIEGYATIKATSVSLLKDMPPESFLDLTTSDLKRSLGYILI